MKKLLLLATGGTITAVQGEEGLAPGMDAEELVSFLQAKDQSVQLESKLLMNIDSTNMQPESWVEIAKAVYENYPHYDGFVITHGTDTMAYTSAALSYMLQNLSKPVVITGSQIPINYKKTDAKKNVMDAIRFACEDTGGVFLVFDGRVIRGTRAVKIRTKSYDAFESINHPYVAYINESEIKYVNAKPAKSSRKLKLDASLCPDVFLLKLLPGTKPELFSQLKPLYKGVIIESFGNGGIPFQGRDLLPKVRELISSGIAVVISTQCLEEGEDLNLYEVGRKVAQDKIILSGDMNTEAIVPKLMWALGKTDDLDEVKNIMEKPINHDTSL
ncbi:asparaginase [Paenibacillus vulneris]|uniref:asparaginase n=1 Tax=Paenibacillus vulneris TaxID=1133364 RepID=A0ABW3USD1_9BACL|nr:MULTISPECIES: asparaginase [unclassified Paenibacillus]MBE1443236.1 L-asparaginase [Paenibacillus sp. OAS669]